MSESAPSYMSEAWKQQQATALYSSKTLASECHPFVPVIKRRDGVVICGFVGYGQLPQCQNVVKGRKPIPPQEKTPSHGQQRIDEKAGDGYQPEPYEPGADG